MTQSPIPTPPRLHLIHASAAATAVIFRRGPSKWVELVRWDTQRDLFERGHWFHGRIYERRADLSPDGKRLIYFASKITARTIRDPEYTYAWTAISKPPWLTALALWPKGDCWHGGGLFHSSRRVLLNHAPHQAQPHSRHRPPKSLTVEPNPRACGEDEPIFAARLSRDGWTVAQAWEVEWHKRAFVFQTHVPEVRVRVHPRFAAHAIRLTRRLDGLKYREFFEVDGPGAGLALPPGRLDWVDWDAGGRLIVLAQGAVYAAYVAADAISPLRPLIDLRWDRPESRAAPPHAHKW